MIFHQLIHFPEVHSTWSKQAAQNSIQLSHEGGRGPGSRIFPGCAQQEVIPGPPLGNGRVPSSILTAACSACPKTGLLSVLSPRDTDVYVAASSIGIASLGWESSSQATLPSVTPKVLPRYAWQIWGSLLQDPLTSDCSGKRQARLLPNIG